MVDIAIITTALKGIKTAIEIASALRDADISLEKAELKLQIADLISTLADTRMNMVETQELISQKDAEILSLKDALTLKENIGRYKDAYYTKGPYGYPIGQPFCSYCWEVNHQTIHLHKPTLARRQKLCPACKNIYANHGTSIIDIEGSEV